MISRVLKMWNAHYDHSASKIQALWKGHKNRKYTIDFHKMRKWLDIIYTKNQETINNMLKFVLYCYEFKKTNSQLFCFRFRREETEIQQKVVECTSMIQVINILLKVTHCISLYSSWFPLKNISLIPIQAPTLNENWKSTRSYHKYWQNIFY